MELNSINTDEPNEMNIISQWILWIKDRKLPAGIFHTEFWVENQLIHSHTEIHQKIPFKKKKLIS